MGGGLSERGWEYYLVDDHAEELLSVWGLEGVRREEYRHANAALDYADLLKDYQVLVVDRGNRLTDFVGIVCNQVIIPDLWPRRDPLRGPGGMPYPFA